MSEGSRRLRTIVASTRMATAKPTPNSCMIASWIVKKAPKTQTMIAAALVTVPAVIVIPLTTASLDGRPRSLASFTRVRMKTW